MWRYIVPILAGLVLGGTSVGSSYAQQTQEVYLDFRYANVVNTVVTAQYSEGEVYLPVGELFQSLRINYSIEPDQNRVAGFYLNRDSTYTVNWSTGRARVGKREIDFDTTAVLRGQLDVYLRPELFSRFFGLDFGVDLQRLRLTLETDRTVPRIAALRREQERRLTQGTANIGPREFFPSPTFTRDESWIDGGVMDYRLTGNFFGTNPSYNMDLQGGFELMGGDFEAGGIMEYRDGNVTLSRRDSRWRYVVPGERVVRQMMVGELRSSALRDVPYRGIRLTNEPITRRRFFGTYTVQGETEPGWEVELYLNGRLVEVKEANHTGAYTFNVPLTYGTSVIEIRSYGPTGGVQEERRRIELPFEFLPADSLQYDIFVGQNRRTEAAVVQSRTGFGLTKWLTSHVGVEYLSDTLSVPVGYTDLSARIGVPYVLSARIVPGVLYRAGFSAFYTSYARFDARYTHFAKRGYYNTARADGQGRANAYIPFSILGQNLSLQLSENAVHRGDRVDLQSRVGLSFSLGSLRIRGEYRRTDVGENFDIQLRDALIFGSVFARPDLSFLWPGAPSFMVRSSMRYNQTRKTLQTGQIGIVRSLTRYGNVTFEFGRDFERDFFFGGLELSLTLPYSRMRSSARSRGASRSLTQTLSGSVGWDHARNTFAFDQRRWTGQGAVSVQMYVDENGNGTPDNEEPVIEEGNLRMRHTAATFIQQGNALRAHALQPYEKYAVFIDERSVANPLWIPDYSAFSVRIEPNGYTAVNLPFYVSGIIEGQVVQVEEGEKEPVGGLNLHLKAREGEFEKTVRVFNDGSFYSYSIPPGQYTMRVDSSHLQILGAQSDPEVLKFEVDATPEGDIVDGLQFVLRDRGQTPDEAADSGAITEDRRGPEVRGVLEPSSGYIVQLAAYGRIESARAFARRSQKVLDRRVHTRYDSSRRAYVVHLDTLHSQARGQRLLDEIQRREAFSDAMLRPASPPPSKNWYALQAGAFSGSRSAVDYAMSLKKRIPDRPLQVIVTEEGQLHKVLIEPGPNRADLEELREVLQQSTSLDQLVIVRVDPEAIPRGS